MDSKNIVWHDASVDRKERNNKNGHESFVLWFTGLSGSGKSTLANAVSRKLFEENKQTYVLDGDNVRHGLNKDLGFSPEARTENIRRIGEVAKLFVDSGQIVSTAFISPYREDRQQVRDLLQENEFIEIHVDCSLSTCEERDPKGLYKKARTGEIPSFTGVSSPYEAPENPEIVVNTEENSIEAAVDIIVKKLEDKGLV
ncbi:adenylylsulfate kinase [Salibacterium salarium]|uniref:Adenylyl-sulfate kinase n=1 Tax=Salibacterium salarium TaxID=284579 RepID=A0A3R9QKP8_9BACI|nr:adenylyl-sulfate kinase [Salibacterium salarium]MDQ0300796.1 adenylylsulfate kinase [Salibacterium salarium]RSL32513.1 adenylyl-sulfate kinase [Salibacterium salarium]